MLVGIIAGTCMHQANWSSEECTYMFNVKEIVDIELTCFVRRSIKNAYQSPITCMKNLRIGYKEWGGR